MRTNSEAIIIEEGQTLLGWRDVPVDLCDLGKTAVASMPFLKQVFIQKDPAITDSMVFERKLYTIRKQAEKKTKKEGAVSFTRPAFLPVPLFIKGC